MKSIDVLLWIVAAVLVIAGAGTVASQTAPGVFFLCFGVVCAGLAWVSHRMNRRRWPGLTVVVSDDRLEMWREGRQVDVIEKAEVGLIILDVLGPAGLAGFRVFRSDQSWIGQWETNWVGGGGPFRSIRAFRHYNYPWLVHNPVALARHDKVRSKTAPSWADRVVGV